MKKIFPFFLLALLFGCCFWRVQTLAPETPLSLRSIFLVSAKPTIVLNEIKEEKNVFTMGRISTLIEIPSTNIEVVI